MAILTSAPGEGNEVKVYDVPDDVLSQYAVSGEKAEQMFPESAKPTGSGIPKATAAMSATKVENAESLGEVQAYGNVCICRVLLCNHWHCWWHYYYCWC
jgi:hypothetical protein